MPPTRERTTSGALPAMMLSQKANAFVSHEHSSDSLWWDYSRQSQLAQSIFSECDVSIRPIAYPLHKYATLTDNVLYVDQAMVQAQQLVRQLAQARMQHAKDVTALRQEVAALWAELRHTAVDEPPTFPWTDDETQKLEHRLFDALSPRLGEVLSGLSTRVVEDTDFGGRVLEVTIVLACSTEAFREARALALMAYDAATSETDTRNVVVLVQRRAG
jgi:hypothetical protein